MKDTNFVRIVEDTIYRYQNGGLITGDLVKFRKNALNHGKIKDMTESYKDMVKNAMETDLNLRVSAVKSIRPTTSGNMLATDAPGDFFVDLCIEYAPGLWRDPITVPIEVLERVDTGINLAPVPDSLKRKNKEEMPKEIKAEGDRNLTTKNTKGAFTSEPKDGRSQIKKPVPYKESIYHDGLMAIYEEMKKK